MKWEDISKGIAKQTRGTVVDTAAFRKLHWRIPADRGRQQRTLIN
jgi:hypothetical protein